MLSGMENYEETLRAADRAAAAPFTQTPRTPPWYPFAIAAYITSVAAAFLLLHDGHVLLGLGLLVAAMTVVLTVALTIRGKWGTWPRLSTAPTEFKRAFGIYIVLALIALLISSSLWTWFGPALGLIAFFITALIVIWAYEFHLYPAAAQQVKQRLA